MRIPNEWSGRSQYTTHTSQHARKAEGQTQSHNNSEGYIGRPAKHFAQPVVPPRQSLDSVQVGLDGRQGTVYAVAGCNRIRRAQWQTAYRRDWLLVNNRNRRRERPAASFFRPGSMDFSANAPPRASTFFPRKTKSPPFSTYPQGNVNVLSRESKNSPRGCSRRGFPT